MTAIPTPPLPKYTVADSERWEGRWDLIEGIPYAMILLPIPKHQIDVGQMIYESKHALRKYSGLIGTPPMDYKVSEKTMLEPDMLIFDRMPSEKHINFPPLLVAEVQSPSTRKHDCGYKFQQYQEQQTQCYLMEDIDAETV